MFLRIFSQARTNLTHLFVIIFICVGYFNYFIVTEAVIIFFQISSLTGQLLVNKFLSICNCIFEIVNVTCSFFQILYEDFLIFFKDAMEKISFTIYLLKELYLFLEESGWTLFYVVLRALETGFSFLEFLQYSVMTTKQGIELIGSAIWCVFSNIPGTVILCINTVNEFIKNTVIEIRNSIYILHIKIIESIEKTYQFFFDVPFDSTCGLIVGVFLVAIICAKFKDIYYFISTIFLKLHMQVTAFIMCLWSGRFLEHKKRQCIDYSAEDDERLCIVCQHQLKEIIIFPCKHLCLCGDCTNQLTKNQPLCPICRSNITGTLKVYL